ncbi:hypothetical protein [Lyngbya confervoides]|uniref:Uncharacterized protein n=1 Tax=Lyngbya confervoides BDU141951 TaxID=1574623 RepID=A0ABD4T3K9_9CYAN|nr:hypothetical protein [Lyngbya confervoides]MCM1983063.1 hypothetical protein [Lyngbya confervoides BDU141951]
MGSVTSSEVYEVVYAERDCHRLYAEVIQKIEGRKRLWVRPLCLCEYEPRVLCSDPLTLRQIHDVRGDSDLVWPAVVFTQALDQDWLAVLTGLSPEAPSLGMRSTGGLNQAGEAKQKLRQFLQEIKPLN